MIQLHVIINDPPIYIVLDLDVPVCTLNFIDDGGL